MKRGELRKLKIGTWVKITWDDAVGSDEGWIDDHKVETEIAACITVGKVIKKDRKQVVLAQSAGPNDNQVGNIWAIPLGWINQVEVWN